MRRSLLLLLALGFLAFCGTAQAQNCNSFTGHVDLRNCTFSLNNMANAKFDDGDLSGATFNAVNLSHASFLRSKAEGAHFATSNLSSANFTWRPSDGRGFSKPPI